MSKSKKNKKDFIVVKSNKVKNKVKKTLVEWLELMK